MIYQKISRDAGDPGAECSVNIAVASKRFVNAHENFLREVFSLLPLIGEAVAEVVYTARMAPHKFLPSGAVTAKALLDQLSFWFQFSVGLESTVAFGLHLMERIYEQKSSTSVAL
jgi:hypothetical protein